MDDAVGALLAVLGAPADVSRFVSDSKDGDAETVEEEEIAGIAGVPTEA